MGVHLEGTWYAYDLYEVDLVSATRVTLDRHSNPGQPVQKRV